MKHLTHSTINDIALHLNDDVYGANGDLTELEIKQRLVDAIHSYTNYAYTSTGLVPVWHVADLIQSVWEYEDREYMKLLGETAGAGAEGQRPQPQHGR